MTDVYFDSISMRDVFTNPNLQLSQHVRAAEGPAREAIRAGEYIRQTHAHGRSNTSLESTATGAEYAARRLLNDMTGDTRDDRLFGNHIRELAAALKLLWRK